MENKEDLISHLRDGQAAYISALERIAPSFTIGSMFCMCLLVPPVLPGLLRGLFILMATLCAIGILRGFVSILLGNRMFLKAQRMWRLDGNDVRDGLRYPGSGLLLMTTFLALGLLSWIVTAVAEHLTAPNIIVLMLRIILGLSTISGALFGAFLACVRLVNQFPRSSANLTH